MVHQPYVVCSSERHTRLDTQRGTIVYCAMQLHMCDSIGVPIVSLITNHVTLIDRLFLFLLEGEVRGVDQSQNEYFCLFWNKGDVALFLHSIYK